MADPTDGAESATTNGHQDASADLLRELVAHLAQQPHRSCARNGRAGSARRGC